MGHECQMFHVFESNNLSRRNILENALTVVTIRMMQPTKNRIWHELSLDARWRTGLVAESPMATLARFHWLEAKWFLASCWKKTAITSVISVNLYVVTCKWFKLQNLFQFNVSSVVAIYSLHYPRFSYVSVIVFGKFLPWFRFFCIFTFLLFSAHISVVIVN